MLGFAVLNAFNILAPTGAQGVALSVCVRAVLG